MIKLFERAPLPRAVIRANADDVGSFARHSSRHTFDEVVHLASALDKRYKTATMPFGDYKLFFAA